MEAKRGRDWTPADVLHELASAFGSMSAAYSPQRAVFSSIAVDGTIPQLDLIAFSDSWLGRRSPERIALITRARHLGRPHPHASIRSICRDRAGWSGSRSGFYRMANRGARLMAKMLNAKGIPAPEQAPQPRRWRKYR